MRTELIVARNLEAAVEGLMAGLHGTFRRRAVHEKAETFIRCLLSNVPRKNGWQMAERAGEASPKRFQMLLLKDRFDEPAVRDAARAAVLKTLGGADGVLVVDETGFLKKGDKSVGVQRQYSGAAGKVENCQIGVFLTYASAKGHALVDRALYLPKSWCDDKERREGAGVPDAAVFATKPQLAAAMVKDALEAGAVARWVLADAVYGGQEFRDGMEALGLDYVLGVSKREGIIDVSGAGGVLMATVEEIAAALPKEAWLRRSAGAGSKGERWFDWAVVKTWKGAEKDRLVLARRDVDDPTEISYSVVRCPAGMPLEELVRVVGRRWTVEECFRTAKGKCGLADYEVRTWAGWHRYVSFALLAQAALCIASVATQKNSAAGRSSRKRRAKTPAPRRGRAASDPTRSPGSSRVSRSRAGRRASTR